MVIQYADFDAGDHDLQLILRTSAGTLPVNTQFEVPPGIVLMCVGKGCTGTVDLICFTVLMFYVKLTEIRVALE